MTTHASHEHEELAEHTCERRDTSQGEERKRHEERQARVGGIEPVVGVHIGSSTVFLLHHIDDAEHRQVGDNIHQHII